MSKNKHRGMVPQFPPGKPQQTTHQQVIAQSSYQGPLPSPKMLQEYNQIVPGMAERLLAAFERQGEHRHGMERKALDYNFRLARVGQVLAVTIGLGALGSGTYLASIGHSTTGIAVMFATIAPMIGAFFWTGRRARSPDQGQGQQKG